jgi:hypothetical protein
MAQDMKRPIRSIVPQKMMLKDSKQTLRQRLRLTFQNIPVTTNKSIRYIWQNKTMTVRRAFFVLFSIQLLILCGCTRCLKCSEVNAAGTPVYDYPETCGDKEDVETMQAQIMANQDPGKKAECTMRR